MGTFDGKVAIITGASKGIGRQIAGAFAREGAGVVMSARGEGPLREAAEEIEAAGGRVAWLVGDAGSRADAYATIALAIDRFGRIDALVNNAIAPIGNVPIADMTDEQFDIVVNSGLRGTLLHMQAAFPHMQERGGAIVNFGSGLGIMGQAGSSIYAATKEAIRGLSRSAAREYGPYNIRVNVVSPAAVTEAFELFMRDNPAMVEAVKANCSLNRLGDPYTDIAPVVLYLCSDAAGFVSGQTVNIDGGFVMS